MNIIKTFKNQVVTKLVFLFCNVLIAGCFMPVKQMPELFCNTHVAVITPLEPVYLAGFANRNGMSDTIHRALRTKCIVLRNDTTRVCLVFNDLMEVAKKYDDHIRSIIADSTGIPVSHIFIMSSHSHSTPIMDEMHLNSSDANDRYRERTISIIAKNAIETIKDDKNFVSCRLQIASGTCMMNTNRRSIDPKTGEAVIGKSEEGLCDHEVQALRFINAEENVIATIFNYACHPVTLGAASKAVSPDYVGMAEETMAKKSGGEAFFMHGAAGDVNPINGLGTSLAATDSEGVKLATAVLSSTFTNDTTKVVLKTASATILLPYRDQDIDSSFINEQVKIKSAQKTDFINWKESVYNWGERMKARLNKESKLPNGRSVSIGAIKLGSTVIFFIQGELFNSYQLKLKKEFPQLHILFAGYTNGEAGYVPDGPAFKAKGYEVDQAYIFLGEPSPLTSDTESIIVKNMEELVRSISE